MRKTQFRWCSDLLKSGNFKIASHHTLDYNKKMTISLCMIVKNEEKTLPKAIESVNQIIDEIVVVDTGSTDKTIEVAKSYGAKVISIEWNDNFGEARNVSIRNAKSEWILVLDADETIAKKDLNRIKELTKNDKYLGYLFVQRNYTNTENVARIEFSDGDKYDESKNFIGWVSSQATRLFKNMPEIFYDDYVHEDVGNVIRKINRNKLCVTDVPIHHFGRVIRSREERLKWSDMYIRIGLKKLNDKIKANAPKRELATASYEIGNSYGFKGDIDKAEEYFKKAEGYDDKFGPCLSALGRIYASMEDLKKGEEYMRRAVIIKDRSVEMLANDYLTLGKIYIMEKKYDAGIKAVRKALDLQPDNVEARNFLWDINKAVLRSSRR